MKRRLHLLVVLSAVVSVTTLGEPGKPSGESLAPKAAVALEDTSAQAKEHLTRGRALYEQDKVDDAMAEFREAVRLDPKSPEAHAWLGMALWKAGDTSGSIAEQREVVRLKPQDALQHVALALALNQKGDRSEALQESKVACELSHAPRICDLYQTLARQPLRRGNIQVVEQGERGPRVMGRSSEDFAIRSMLTLKTAEQSYAELFHKGFSPTLQKLAPTPKGEYPSESRAGLIDAELAKGEKAGYHFTYSPFSQDAEGLFRKFTVTARPVEWKRGMRSFFIDDSGPLRQTDENRDATAQDREVVVGIRATPD